MVKSAWVLGMAFLAGPVAGEEPKAAPRSPGDTTTDLVYTPAAPCRIANTRAAGGSLAPGVPRAFRVTGVGLDVQGGNAAGCNVPTGLASAALLNFVAVNPTGPGNLRAWAYASGTNPPPNASILNYAQVTGLNIANGIAIPICDNGSRPRPQDLRVQADGNGAHLVVDVVGYFHRLATEEATFAVTAENLTASALGTQLQQPRAGESGRASAGTRRGAGLGLAADQPRGRFPRRCSSQTWPRRPGTAQRPSSTACRAPCPPPPSTTARAPSSASSQWVPGRTPST